MDARGCCEQGDIYYADADYKEALLYFTDAIELDDTYAPAYFRLGNTYFNLGELELAIENYNEAIRLNYSKLYCVYSNIGNTYYQLCSYDLAERNFTLAIELTPDNTRDLAIIYCNRGANYNKLEDYSSAIQDLRKGIELKVEDASLAYYNLGFAYAKCMMPAKAIEYFTNALELEPTYAVAKQELSAVMLSIDDNSDLSGLSKETIFKAIKLLPDVEDQNDILRKCTEPDSTSAFRKRVCIPENILVGVIKLFDHNPESYESIRCREDKGILQQMCEYRVTTDLGYSMPDFSRADNEHELGVVRFRRRRK